MTGLSEDCCAYAPRPMTSNAGATTCGSRMYSGLSFVPDICDFRVSLIAAFSEFTPSTPSLTAEPTIDDPSFILNQMVQNWGRIQEIAASSAILLKESVGASGFEPPPPSPEPGCPSALRIFPNELDTGTADSAFRVDNLVSLFQPKAPRVVADDV